MGAQRTLARYHPTLVLELHARSAARSTLVSLAPHGYRYVDLASRREFGDAGELSEWMPDACLQVIGRPD